MPETSERRIISSSSWWIWILLAVGVFIIGLIIYGAWRLWRGATQAIREEVPEVATPQEQPNIRFVRTPTEIIIIDDPIIPAGETAVEAIIDRFEEYQGDTVTISGTVSNFENPSLFSVTQDENTIGVIVLPEVINSNQLQDSADPENQMVRVTGIVKLLTREREKKEFGFELRNIDEAFWQDRMVIEAQTIEIISATTT